MSVDLSKEDLDRLYEGSKDDRYIIVGSEVRQMIGMIRRSQASIAALEAALEEIADPYGDGHVLCQEIARAALKEKHQ